jgi:hypothetical protein
MTGNGACVGDGPSPVLEVDFLDGKFLRLSLKGRMGLVKVLKKLFHVDPNELRGMRVLKTELIEGD